MSLAFGGRFNDVTQVLTVPDSGIVVELPEEMAASGITLGTDNLTIITAGHYKVDFSVILQSASGTLGIVASVRLNGMEVPALSPGFVLGSDFVTLSGSAIVLLGAGDVLDLTLTSATGGDVLLGPMQNAVLSAFLLAPQ